ncbi:hypothetical protein FLTE109939_13305 [Flavobacterium terrigena]
MVTPGPVGKPKGAGANATCHDVVPGTSVHDKSADVVVIFVAVKAVGWLQKAC